MKNNPQYVTIPKMKVGLVFRMPNNQKAMYLIPQEPCKPSPVIDNKDLNIKTAAQLGLINDIQYMKMMAASRAKKVS